MSDKEDFQNEEDIEEIQRRLIAEEEEEQHEKDEDEDSYSDLSDDKSEKSSRCWKFARSFFKKGMSLLFILSFVLQSKIGNSSGQAGFGQQKIQHPQKLVDTLLENIELYVRNVEGNYPSLISAIEELGQDINNSKIQPFVINSFREKNYAIKLQKIAMQLSYACESVYNTGPLELIFLVLHDYVTIDDTTMVYPDAVKKVLFNCDLSSGIINALFSFLTVLTQTNNGRLSMQGMGPVINEFAQSTDFGPNAFNTLAVFSFWTEKANLTKKDATALTDFLQYADNNREKWSNKFKRMYVENQPNLEKYLPKEAI